MFQFASVPFLPERREAANQVGRFGNVAHAVFVTESASEPTETTQMEEFG